VTQTGREPPAAARKQLPLSCLRDMMQLRAATRIALLAAMVTAGCGRDGGARDEELIRPDALEAARRTTPIETPPVDQRDACSLVTREALETIVGGALIEGELEGSKCTYHADAADGTAGWHTVAITARWEGAESELHVWRTATGMMDSRMRASEGASTVSGDELSGLGDEAFFASAGIMDFLLVRVGDAFVRIEGVRSRQQTIAIARLAIERL
jgi:hypothetical protein